MDLNPFSKITLGLFTPQQVLLRYQRKECYQSRFGMDHVNLRINFDFMLVTLLLLRNMLGCETIVVVFSTWQFLLP